MKSEIDILVSRPSVCLTVKTRLTDHEITILGQRAGVVPQSKWADGPIDNTSFASYPIDEFEGVDTAIEYVRNTAVLVAAVLRPLRQTVAFGSGITAPTASPDSISITPTKVWVP
jgi:hypothetical protein